MNIKSVVSSLLVLSTLSVALHMKKAQAGVLLTAGSLVVSMNAKGNMSTGIVALTLGAPAGVVLSVAGVITAIANPALGVALIILSEDGSLPQNDLEAVLAQKYPFIQDNKVIADLAILVKSKAKTTKEMDGKKMISLSENEIRSILESTDLVETHTADIQSMIVELK